MHDYDDHIERSWPDTTADDRARSQRRPRHRPTRAPGNIGRCVCLGVTIAHRYDRRQEERREVERVRAELEWKLICERKQAEQEKVLSVCKNMGKRV